MARQRREAHGIGSAGAQAAPPRWAWAAAIGWMALTALLLGTLQPAVAWMSLCRS